MKTQRSKREFFKKEQRKQKKNNEKAKQNEFRKKNMKNDHYFLKNPKE